MNQEKDIIRFLKDNIQPLNNSIYGVSYRAAVHLTDGTYLPCVLFRNPRNKVNLAIKRFKEEQQGKGIFGISKGNGYYNIVKNFVTNGNSINYYDIEKVEKSPFAFPSEILSKIQGETTMGWTGFSVKMKDGKYFSFGTRLFFKFFQIPDNYSIEDIAEIINHSYVSENGELKFLREDFTSYPDDYKISNVYREKIFFECFIDSL